MRVLVTGGAGFIGTHVVTALSRDGHTVTSLDLRTGSDPGVPGILADVRDPAAVTAALVGMDAVVHLAAKVGLERGLQDAHEYVLQNDGGTAVLLAAMERSGVGRLVLASSMVVYGEGLGRCGQHGPVRPGPRRQPDLDEGRGRPRTVLELATSLAAAAGAPAPLVTGRARLADVRHITASSERANSELGWRAREDFDASMVELLG